MPTSTIPFDPSLVLGMIVDPGKIQQLEAIATLQLPVDLARDHVNSLIRQKLSLDMTARELVSLGVDATTMDDFGKNVEDIKTAIVAAAVDLGKAVIDAEKAIVAAKTSQGQQQIGSQVQSPIDFAASQLQALPISADSLNMDVQYFRYEDNEQQANDTAKSIATSVGLKVSGFLGSGFGAQAASSAASSIATARNNHSIKGTLVICANCTSRQAQVFSPLKLDVDTAINSFNIVQANDPMPVEDPNAMRALALSKAETDPTKTLPILVGATYGSSFVGFVHLEQLEDSSSSQSAQSSATSVQTEVERDLFLKNVEGSWGLDSQSSSSLKNLLSTSSVQSHCSVITMGLIPSIKSNQVLTSVKALQNDPKENMSEAAAMQDSTDASTSVASAAAASRKGQTVSQLKSDYIKAAVSAVSDVDQATNQVIDLNSLQVALDDYVAKAAGGTIGVPINFYLRYVSKKDIAVAWMEKYYPDLLHPADAGNT